MSYSVRPYVKLGVIPNPNLLIEVKDGKITRYRQILGGRDGWLGEQPINEATTVNSTKANLLKRGSVRITTDGATVDYENLPNVQDFMSAVSREKQKIRGKKERSASDKQELKSESIIIPPPPEAIQYCLQGTTLGTTKFFRSKISYERESGDWVAKGETLAHVPPGKVVSPCDGVVRHIGGEHEQKVWAEETRWPRRWAAGFRTALTREMAMVIIQPAKNADVPDHYVAVAHAPMLDDARVALGKLEALTDKQLQQSFQGHRSQVPSEMRESIRISTLKAISMIEAAKPHRIVGGPVEEIPEWPSRAWIETYAPTAGLEYTPAPDDEVEIDVRNLHGHSENGGNLEPELDPPDPDPPEVDQEAVRFDEAHVAAMQRFGVKLPITEDELAERWHYLRKNRPGHLHKQIDSDYIELLKLVS